MSESQSRRRTKYLESEVWTRGSLFTAFRGQFGARIESNGFRTGRTLGKNFETLISEDIEYGELARLHVAFMDCYQLWMIEWRYM
jgi:hypothetical protein